MPDDVLTPDEIKRFRIIYEEYHRNFEWFNRNFKKLRKKYGGKYVAVSGRRVVGVADRYEDIERIFEHNLSVYIGYIPDINEPDIIFI
jgi:hypothetical protein